MDKRHMIPLEFSPRFIMGCSRCKTLERLERYRLDWRADVLAHPDRDAMVEAYKARRLELTHAVEPVPKRKPRKR